MLAFPQPPTSFGEHKLWSPIRGDFNKLIAEIKSTDIIAQTLISRLTWWHFRSVLHSLKCWLDLYLNSCPLKWPVARCGAHRHFAPCLKHTSVKAQGKSPNNYQQNIPELLFDLVPPLTYKICSIHLHQLSQCPGEGKRMSSCVFGCMCVCGYQYLMKKANILNRFTIQGVERRTRNFHLRSLKLSIELLTGIMNTLIRGDVSFVDLFREADLGQVRYAK